MKDGLIVCALVVIGVKMVAAYRAEIRKFAATH